MPNGGWSYRPYAAQRRADAREPRPQAGKIGQDPRLRDFLQDHVTRRWNPEQICHALQARFPDQRRCTWSTRRSTRRFTSKAAGN